MDYKNSVNINNPIRNMHNNYGRKVQKWEAKTKSKQKLG